MLPGMSRETLKQHTSLSFSGTYAISGNDHEVNKAKHATTLSDPGY